MIAIPRSVTVTFTGTAMTRANGGSRRVVEFERTFSLLLSLYTIAQQLLRLATVWPEYA